MGMQIGVALYIIKHILAEVCTLDEYKGKEEETVVIYITGYKYTSVCPNRLRAFSNCRTLDISYTNFTSIPYGIEYLQNLQQFYFNNNIDIGNHELVKLSSLVHLTVLSLAKNNIKQIPDCLKSFDYADYITLGVKKYSFTNLEELNIEDNHIESIPQSFFTLVSLRRLNISNNRICHIPPNIQLLVNLTELIIKQNYIRFISKNICCLKSLEVFDASRSNIDNLPDYFFNLNTLKRLILAHNTLRTIPSQIYQLKNLTELNISHNVICKLPIEIGSLLCLKNLKAQNNKFKIFPQNFYLPENICVLDISSNALTALPKLDHLHKLMRLDVSYNDLNALPSSIGLLQSLDTLNASFNYLQKLPSNFGEAKLLTQLTLGNNSLSALPASFSNLNSMVHLSLDNNYFTKIPYEILDFHELYVLEFNGNLIENLTDNNFVELPMPNTVAENNINLVQNTLSSEKSIFLLGKLELAYFDNNKITTISSEIKLLKHLKVLSLANNMLKNLPEEIGVLENLSVLNLQANLLQCLPFSITELRKNELNVLRVQCNFITLKDSKLGLGINSIKNLDFKLFECYEQCTYITIDEVIDRIKEDDLYWNIDKLKKIKILANLSDFSEKISDKQMRKIWRVVLKYFIISKPKQREPDSDSSDEINIEEERKITSITSSDVFINIKNSVINEYQTAADNETTAGIDLSLAKKVSNLLRNNSTTLNAKDVAELKMQNLLKNYIKALFSKILEKIIEDNFSLDSIELIKLSLTDLCEHKLFECINGQLEGLQYYYSIFYSVGNNVRDNSIVDYIKSIIAAIKETTFVNVTNNNNKNSVHFISKYRAIFKDIIGITYAYDDPYSSLFPPITCKFKKGSVLNDFFTYFNIDMVSNEILDKINMCSTKVNESVDLLKNILKTESPSYDEYSCYMNAIQSYFEYEKITGYSELLAKKLKKEGLIKILIHLQILRTNKTT